MNTLKIIEWNVNSVANKCRIKKIIDKILEQKADIIVLTEVTESQRTIMSSLLENSERNYTFAATSNQTPNGVAIIAASDKIHKVIFHDIRTYANKNSKNIDSFPKKFYPDALIMIAYLKNQQKVCFMGTRFSIYKLKKENKQSQIRCFFEIVKKYKPHVIIGDFNWDTAIKNYLELEKGVANQNEETSFCSLANWGRNQVTFKMLPQEGYSYVAKRGNGYTNPDRIMYDTKTFSDPTEQRVRYVADFIESSGFSNEWPSDHAMLICELTLGK